MRTEVVIKLRNIILMITGILLFVGAQIVPAASTGQTQSLLESFGMSSILIGIHLMLWSDYTYNDMIENGLKINYKLYQYIGLLAVLLMLIIILNAYYLAT